jgi:hypothetical protein
LASLILFGVNPSPEPVVLFVLVSIVGFIVPSPLLKKALHPFCKAMLYTKVF